MPPETVEGEMMAVWVQTKTVCDGCGLEDVRKGAEKDTPPVSWASLDLIRRDAGAGWTNNKHLLHAVICPACAGVIVAAFEGLKVRPSPAVE